MNSIEIYWYSWGRYKKQELTYKNGLLNGKTTSWGDPTAHVKKAEINYKNNLLHGKSTTWFGNREKDSERNYKNGKKDGKFILWYYNKQKKSEEVFKNDVRQGKPKYWYPNGKEKDEYIVKLELREIERGFDMQDMISGDTYAEYEKNYEGYDKYGDGTIEGIYLDDGDYGEDFGSKIWK